MHFLHDTPPPPPNGAKTLEERSIFSPKSVSFETSKNQKESHITLGDFLHLITVGKIEVIIFFRKKSKLLIF